MSMAKLIFLYTLTLHIWNKECAYTDNVQINMHYNFSLAIYYLGNKSDTNV